MPTTNIYIYEWFTWHLCLSVHLPMLPLVADRNILTWIETNEFHSIPSTTPTTNPTIWHSMEALSRNKFHRTSHLSASQRHFKYRSKIVYTLECMNSRHTNKNRPNQVYYCLRLFAVNFAFIDFRLRMCIPFNRSQKGKVLYIAPNRLSAIKITQLPNAVYVLISISLANHITMNEAVAPLKEHFYCVTPHSSGAVCVCVYNLRPVK